MRRIEPIDGLGVVRSGERGINHYANPGESTKNEQQPHEEGPARCGRTRGHSRRAGRLEKVTLGASRRTWRSTLVVGAGLLVAVAACSGSMSADEYVAGLNGLVATAAPDLEASLVTYDQIEDPTIADWAAFVDREIAIRRVFVDGFDALDAPDPVADVHRLFDDALDRGLAAAEALGGVTASANTPGEAQKTPEFAEYQAANADGSSRVCLEALAKLDNLAASSEAFADEPWLSGLSLTVRAAFGCIEPEAG